MTIPTILKRMIKDLKETPNKMFCFIFGHRRISEYYGCSEHFVCKRCGKYNPE
ncbi:MAG: hypothetical protein WC438_06320 [Candidatus Pacearchaeota archaeon]